MNENLNLCEILKDCPKGTKLYSPLAGVVELKNIDYSAEYPIYVCYNNGSSVLSFAKDGLYYLDATDGECMLWPSKEVRTWEGFKVEKPKFEPKTLKAFDRILVRDFKETVWLCGLFSCIMNGKIWTSCGWIYGIPYNEETKHLVGTSDEAPEFYRYWEE